MEGVAVLCRNEVLRDSVCALLESHQYPILAASENAAACDVILALPGGQAEALEMLARHPRHATILLMNNVNDRIRTDLIKAGAFAVESSIMSEDALFDLIEAAVRRASALPFVRAAE